MTNWQRVTDIRVSGEGDITAKAGVDEESPWFSGHFPGDPVVPGIAQLAMVYRVIEGARGCRFTVSGVRRVRFKQIVRPGDALRLEIKPLGDDDTEYMFRILKQADVVCTGNLMLERIR